MTEKIFRYTFATLCLTGCLLQIYRISSIYFSYENTTDVRYGSEASISLPALTICAAKHYFVRKEILKIIFNNESNEGLKNDKEIHNYLNRLYIKEQFNALQSAEEILNNSCIVMKTEGINSTESFIDCNKISPIIMSINYYRLCLTIMSQVNGEPDYKYIINSNKFNDIYPLIQIKFPINVQTFYLYIHSRYETLHHPYEKDV
jgi:hypothetical protein